MVNGHYKDGVFHQDCEVCSKEYQQDRGQHEGRRLRGYGLIICKRCFDGNRDGWGQNDEDTIVSRMLERGQSLPPRNAKGLYPLEFGV